MAVPLVTDPTDPQKCFVAAAKPNGYVVCVGTSLYGSLSSVGLKIKNNDRLLANLLAGGDAEAAGAPPAVAANG
jgi:hypothetical protein